MNISYVLTGCAVVLLLFSLWQCGQLIFRSKQLNDPTTRVRMSFLGGEHILIIATVIASAFTEGFYRIVLAIFVNSLSICVSFLVCQQIVHGITSQPFYRPSQSIYREQLELTYLNVYFMAYMYAGVALFPSGLFVVATESLIYYRKHQIEQCIQECLQDVQEDEQIQDEDCPICLIELGEGHITRIKNCRHIFHMQCIKQWLKYDVKCPLDRRQIIPQEQLQPH